METFTFKAADVFEDIPSDPDNVLSIATLSQKSVYPYATD